MTVWHNLNIKFLIQIQMSCLLLIQLKNNLFWWRYIFINSDFWFNNWLSLSAFIIKLDSTSNKNETYGFNCLKCPSATEDMAQFENDLLFLIKYLEFKKVHNDFQMRLLDDIKEIKASNKMFVLADKSRHFTKWKKMNTTNCYKITSLKLIKNRMQRS